MGDLPEPSRRVEVVWNDGEDPQTRLVLCACLEREFLRITELAIPAEVTDTAIWYCATPDGDVCAHSLACPPVITVLLFDQTGRRRMENAVGRYLVDGPVYEQDWNPPTRKSSCVFSRWLVRRG